MAIKQDGTSFRRRFLALTGALFVTTAFAGCLDDTNPGDGDSDNNDDSNGDNDSNTGSGNESLVDELAAENRRFALDLYDELVESEPEANLFCSPYSISVALAMTYAGAQGETNDQMADTLRFTLGDDVHAAIEALADELDERSEVDSSDQDNGESDPFQLNVENTVWGQDGYPFEDDYLNLLDEYYGAGLQEVDFAESEAARETINQWVEDQTEGKIDELLPEGSITDLVRLVLTNAVYFEAAWDVPFDDAATSDEEFTALDGSTSDVPMMRQSESFPYAEVDGHQVIELPYVGDEVGMVVILPEEDEFEVFESGLDLDRFDELVDELEPQEGEIRFPRFEYDSDFALKEVLSDMGMPIAFDENDADFSGIANLEETGENLFIHDAYHDAYISVDEEGTEAAAATGVVVGTESAPMDPFEMRVNRSFFFAIRDRPTDTLLFEGRVIDAGSAQ